MPTRAETVPLHAGACMAWQTDRGSAGVGVNPLPLPTSDHRGNPLSLQTPTSSAWWRWLPHDSDPAAVIRRILARTLVVREKGAGARIRQLLCAPPLTRLESCVASQLPYVALAMVNYVLLHLDGGDPVRRTPQKQCYAQGPRRPDLFVIAPPAEAVISTRVRTRSPALFGNRQFC